MDKNVPPWLAILPTLVIGLVAGGTLTLLSVDAGGWFLEKVLRNSLLGLLLFGGYFFVMGATGILSLVWNMDSIKKFIAIFSVSRWMSLVSGALFGIALAALCKYSGIDTLSLALFATPFLCISWLFFKFEAEIAKGAPDVAPNTRKMAMAFSILAMLIGTSTLIVAWHTACSCKG